MLLIFCLGVSISDAFSQDVDARLATFNEAIGRAYNVDHKGKILIIQGFREKEQVKEDRVNIYDLDLETLNFSEADNLVAVKCYSDLEGCVTQVLMRERKKKNYRNRVVFSVPDGTSGEEIVNKLRLLLSEMAKKY